MAEQINLPLGTPASALDVGAADVHVPGAAKPQPMAILTSKKRKSLKPNQFADEANKAYPIHDKAHADNAAARLEQQKGSMSPDKYRKLKSRIRAAQRRFGEKPKSKTGASLAALAGFHIRLAHSDGTKTVIRHRLSCDSDSSGAAIWLPQTGQLCAFFPINKAEALAETEPDEQGNKRVWVQVARTGAWSGHPQGAFVITEQTLDQMVNNFYQQRFGRIQWDFDHASAMPANSGTIPQIGKPAQGWVYDMKRDGERLYALTEWLPLARQYIEADQYGGVSPVINWHFPDRASGKDVGPTITSVALTNLPFITDMDRPLAADLHGLPLRGFMPGTDPQQQALDASSAYCRYSMPDMLSQLKSAFGLHELATAEMCQNALSNLSDHLDAVDGDGSAHHEGVELGKYVGQLRGLVGNSNGMSSTELVQFIDGLLDAYMKDNGIEDDDSDLSVAASSIAASVEAPPPPTTAPAAETAASVEGANMDPTTAPAPAATPQAAPEPPAATVTAASAAPPVESTSTEPETLPAADVSELTLKNAALEAELAELRTKNAALEQKLTPTPDRQQLLSVEVDRTISLYGKSKGITVDHKPFLLSLLQDKPEGFYALYPKVEPGQEHLLLNLTGGGASNPQNPGTRAAADTSQTAPEDPAVVEAQGVIALGLNGLTDQLEAQGIPFASAQIKADQKLREAHQVLSNISL